jgi:hypothetical protein
MTIVGEPKIEYRAEKPYMGIRVRVPMKGMFKVADQLRKELSVWFKQHHLEVAGPPFLRYHVIDMAGDMDIEVGFPVGTAIPDGTRVKAGVLPKGRYAYLIYIGHGLTGRKMKKVSSLGWGYLHEGRVSPTRRARLAAPWRWFRLRGARVGASCSAYSPLQRVSGSEAVRLRGARVGASPHRPRQGQPPLGSPILC